MRAGDAPEHRVGRGRRAAVVKPLVSEVKAVVAAGAAGDRQVLGGPEDAEDEQRGLARLRHRPLEREDQPAQQRMVEGHVSDLRVGRAAEGGELDGGALGEDVRVRDHPGRGVHFDVFRVVAFAGRVFAFGRAPGGDFQRREDVRMAAGFRGRRNALEFVDVAGRRCLGGTGRRQGDRRQPGQQCEAKVAARASWESPGHAITGGMATSVVPASAGRAVPLASPSSSRLARVFPLWALRRPYIALPSLNYRNTAPFPRERRHLSSYGNDSRYPSICQIGRLRASGGRRTRSQQARNGLEPSTPSLPSEVLYQLSYPGRLGHLILGEREGPLAVPLAVVPRRRRH